MALLRGARRSVEGVRGSRRSEPPRRRGTASGGSTAAAARRGTASPTIPEANCVYVGTGNGSPWNRTIAAPAAATTSTSSSIVALNADTGEYVWHYQTTPGDDWDYNAAQPMILADLTIGGQPRKVIMQAPKNGFFYVIDRVTGKLISGAAVTRHVVGDVDRHEDRPADRNRAKRATLHAGAAVAVAGRRASLAADGVQPGDRAGVFPGPGDQLVFAMEEKFDFKEGQWNIGTAAAARRRRRRRPPDPKAPPAGGFFVAWDPVANKRAWQDSVPAKRRRALNGRGS